MNPIQAYYHCNCIDAYFPAQSSRVRPFALRYTPRQYLQYMMMLQAQQGAAAQAAPPPTAPSTDPQQCLGCEDSRSDKEQDIYKKSAVPFFSCRWTFKDLRWMFKSFSRKISQLTNIVVKWVDTTSASKSHVVEPRVKYATRLQICPLHIFGNPKTTPKNRKPCIFLPWKGLQFFQGPRL